MCVMKNKGSVAKIIEMKIAEGINILLKHKSMDCLNHYHFKSYMWTKMYMCTCMYMFTYTCTQSTYIYVQKHENVLYLELGIFLFYRT